MNKKTERYLCIHGHFYQPPRENPWTDTIFIQKSAHPYHDWNERITRECYGPNTRSRLHGEKGYIKKLVNNFEMISFNFGPTLLKWLERYNPWVYDQIINADRLSAERFGGHGNAMAQVYNHLIMPLASERDKITQVKWGLADFHQRFGRKAEGMWLAETAVDSKTLEVLAKEGVSFTILSPYQAHLIRPLNAGADNQAWQDVSSGNVDCTRPYRCYPTDDKNLYIDLFFYNGPLSKAIAYEKILASGEVFLKKIIDAYPVERDNPALVSMATDGESYGHHFKFGEMALTWVLEMVIDGKDITLTNYGEFLENFPPEYEVKIIENSAWSCAHGIERWRSDCGCSVSQNPGWTQAWRAPLRNGLNWLNEHLSSIFEDKTKDLLIDCWQTRDDYISIILKPDDQEKQSFLLEHASKPLNDKESRLVYQLLESQQMALYMFTSCGWFFDDIAGLEAIQILTYAKKAIELCRDFSGDDLEEGLKGFLSEAVCNDPKYKNGLDVYIKEVVPLELDDKTLLANYAMVCAIDSNQVPEWLKTVLTPGKEEKIENGDPILYLYETTLQGFSRNNKSELFSLCLKTDHNEIICIIGERNEDAKQMMLKELDRMLPLKGETGSIVKLFQRFVNNSRVFTIRDLIPDIKRLIVRMLSDQLESRLYNIFIDDIKPIQNYLKTISVSGEDVSSQFNDLFRSVFLNQLGKLLKNSENIPIDFTVVENFFELFNRDNEEIIENDNDVFILDNLVNQQKTPVMIEDYLSSQLEKLKYNNINLYLNNIINTVEFINKYKIKLDWWKCQNTFNDLRTDNNFINGLENTSLSLFRQIEHLLGFTGGI